MLVPPRLMGTLVKIPARASVFANRANLRRMLRLKGQTKNYLTVVKFVTVRSVGMNLVVGMGGLLFAGWMTMCYRRLRRAARARAAAR